MTCSGLLIGQSACILIKRRWLVVATLSIVLMSCFELTNFVFGRWNFNESKSLILSLGTLACLDLLERDIILWLLDITWLSRPWALFVLRDEPYKILRIQSILNIVALAFFNSWFSCLIFKRLNFINFVFLKNFHLCIHLDWFLLARRVLDCFDLKWRYLLHVVFRGTWDSNGGLSIWLSFGLSLRLLLKINKWRLLRRLLGPQLTSFHWCFSLVRLL